MIDIYFVVIILIYLKKVIIIKLIIIRIIIFEKKIFIIIYSIIQLFISKKIKKNKLLINYSIVALPVLSSKANPPPLIIPVFLSETSKLQYKFPLK